MTKSIKNGINVVQWRTQEIYSARWFDKAWYIKGEYVLIRAQCLALFRDSK